MRNFTFVLYLSILLCGSISSAKAQLFPKLIKKDKTEQDSSLGVRRSIELREFDKKAYLQRISDMADSALFKNDVKLGKVRSIVSEETDYTIWAPTNRLAKISEQVLIDSIWVTAFEYYASWDSHQIDIYNFDVRGFQDTVAIQLYDPFFGYSWNMPLEKIVLTSRFGYRRGRWHYGSDLDLHTGDMVHAAFDGIVRISSYNRYGYGNYIVIRHKNGLETLYGHLSKSLVKVGQEVRSGELIGLGGNTGRSFGSHLHYEVRYRGAAFDPEHMYDFSSGKIKNRTFTITPGTFGQVSKARKSAYHRVRSGDTLSGIAKRYGVTVSTIARLNKISTRSVLRIGQNLRIR